jgi:hypothetical protein
MTNPPLPEFIIAGPQKCATTWLYDCLREHPDVYLPDTDSVHYFDMNYEKGDQWYRQFFSDCEDEFLIGEETPSYIRDEKTPKRIAETLPDVKIIFIVRNPIERAFSHYWHERSKNKIAFGFEEVFENYDLYQNWIVPGFYSRHFDRYESHLASEQIKIMFFEDLVADQQSYLQEVYDFLELPDYTPSMLGKKSNDGQQRGIYQYKFYQSIRRAVGQNVPESIIKLLRPIDNWVIEVVTSQNEYEQGMEESVRRQLERVFLEEAKRLESYTDRSFDHWFEHVNIYE